MIKKSFPFFSFDFESVFAKHPTGNILSFLFYPKAVYFVSVSFGIHGPPLTLKTDRWDIRGLDLEKMTSFTHLSLTFQRVNTIYYICKHRFESLKAQNSRAAY